MKSPSIDLDDIELLSGPNFSREKQKKLSNSISEIIGKTGMHPVNNLPYSSGNNFSSLIRKPSVLQHLVMEDIKEGKPESEEEEEDDDESEDGSVIES